MAHLGILPVSHQISLTWVKSVLPPGHAIIAVHPQDKAKGYDDFLIEGPMMPETSPGLATKTVQLQCREVNTRDGKCSLSCWWGHTGQANEWQAPDGIRTPKLVGTP